MPSEPAGPVPPSSEPPPPEPSPPEPSSPEAQNASPEQRLHPVSILFGFASTVRKLIVPIAVVLLANERALFLLLFFLPFIPFALGSLFRYHSFRYRYGPKQLVIRSGVFFRKERHIPYGRIQNIDAVQNPVHRALKVATLRLDTGGGDEPEAVMSVVPLAAVEEMRRRVFAGKNAAAAAGGAVAGEPAASDSATEDAGLYSAGGAGGAGGAGAHGAAGVAGAHGALDATANGVVSGTAVHRAAMQGATGGARATAEETLLLDLPPRELLLSGFILSRGLVVVAAGIGYLWGNGYLDALPERLVGEDFAGFVVMEGYVSRLISDGRVLEAAGLAIVAIGFLSLLLRLLSAAWSLLRLFGFRLARIGEDLRAEYGLITRVIANIPLRRVQTLTIRENLLHRMFGRGSIRVATAQGAAGEDRVRTEWLAPLVHTKGIPSLVQGVLSEVDLASVEWKGVHERAFVRAFRMPVIRGGLLSLALGWFIGWWAGAILLILIGYAYLKARVSLARLGWATSDKALVFRSGWLTTHTSVARFTKIQAVGMRESFFDRRFGMARVIVDTAGAKAMKHTFVIPYLPREVAAELHALLARQAERTELQW